MNESNPKDCLSWAFRPAKEFVTVADEWDAMNDAHYRSPVLTSAFFGLALRHFGSGREKVAIGRAGNHVVALAVLNSSDGLSAETFQPSQAPLGAWIHEPSFTIGDVATSLLRALPRRVLLLGVTQQDPDLFPRPQTTADRLIQSNNYIQTARISVSGSFDTYWQSRGKNLRQNWRTRQNRLGKTGQAFVMDTVTSPAFIEQAVDEYGLLESAGWKGSEGSAVSPENAQGRFYRELLSHEAQRNLASVPRYVVDGRLVCADLCVVRDGTLVVLKTAHCEEDRWLSPGLLLHHDLFRDLFASGGIQRIEFYGRVMDWHLRWTNEIRTMYHLNVYRSVAARRVAQLWRCLPLVKSS